MRLRNRSHQERKKNAVSGRRRSPKGAEQEAAEVVGKLGHRKLKGRAPL